MRNKKAMEPFGIITAAIIMGILLFIFVGPVIKGIFVDQQIAYASGKTEEITINCDDDDVIGFSDQCPCNPDIQELESKEKCGDPHPDAEEKCPKLCKK